MADELKEYFAYYKNQRPFSDGLEKRIRSAKGLIASLLPDDVKSILKKII